MRVADRVQHIGLPTAPLQSVDLKAAKRGSKRQAATTADRIGGRTHSAKPSDRINPGAVSRIQWRNNWSWVHTWVAVRRFQQRGTGRSWFISHRRHRRQPRCAAGERRTCSRLIDRGARRRAGSGRCAGLESRDGGRSPSWSFARSIADRCRPFCRSRCVHPRTRRFREVAQLCRLDLQLRLSCDRSALATDVEDQPGACRARASTLREDIFSRLRSRPATVRLSEMRQLGAMQGDQLMHLFGLCCWPIQTASRGICAGGDQGQRLAAERASSEFLQRIRSGTPCRLHVNQDCLSPPGTPKHSAQSGNNCAQTNNPNDSAAGRQRLQSGLDRRSGALVLRHRHLHRHFHRGACWMRVRWCAGTTVGDGMFVYHLAGHCFSAARRINKRLDSSQF